MGVVFKAVAQSIYTPPSFASIVTGLNPPRHKVFDFFDSLPSRVPSLFELPLNVSYWDEEASILYKVFKEPYREPLENLREPFIYLERALETHIPYGFPGTVQDYLRKIKGNLQRIRRDYIKGVLLSLNKFLKRLQVLRERGILERTLIIFTSDHGETLGEYGKLVNHNFPACPELVYVPAIFIHSLLSGEMVNRLIRHVDLLPTISELLNIEIDWSFEGVNIFLNNKKLYGFNYFKRLWRKLISSSIWDFNNGYVRVYGKKRDLMKSIIIDMIKYTHDLKPLKYHAPVRVFGRKIKNAEELLKMFESRPTYGIAESIDLSPKIVPCEKARIRRIVRALRKSFYK